MGMDNQQTVAQYAAQTGRTWGAVSKRLQRAGIKTGINMPLTDDIKTIIDCKKQAGKTPAKALPLTIKKDTFTLSPATHHNWVATTEQTKTAPDKTTPKQTTKTDDKKTWWTGRNTTLVLLLVAPTLASVRNIFAVCMSVMGEYVGSVALTAVICVTGGALTYIGVKNVWSWFLIAAVLAFETLANITIIYDGLMGGVGNPTRFLGVVTDIFNTGTHGTAIALGAIVSLLLVGAQFAALNELNK
jgi:hypothetical protein